MSSPLKITHHGAVALWTVDRPETRNAVDGEVHDALSSALESAEVEPGCRAIVLTGSERCFLSGGDLKFIRDAPRAQSLAFCSDMTRLLEKFESSPLPILAALRGVALGGGCEVLVACDYRIAAPSAKLAFKQVAMGLTTGWGGGRRLSRLVPRGRALRLLMAGEVLDGTASYQLGLVDEVADDPVGQALELGALIAAHPPRAVAGAKSLVREIYGQGESADDPEWRIFETLWGGPEHNRAVDEFFRARAKRRENIGKD